MSFLSHNSSNHSHLQKKLHKKNSTLHSVTSGEHASMADQEKPRPFAPIQIDKDAPPPQSGFKSSIFGLS